ncbi:hypothetical protein FQZ39_26645, partial [Escherichia coli]|nr:hypothetical protein [Escherichia coli]
ANMLRARVTDAFVFEAAAPTVSDTIAYALSLAPTVITEPDGTVEISVTSQTAGIRPVPVTLNHSPPLAYKSSVAAVRTAKF